MSLRNGDFFSAAAQVLPVLFLASAVEFRLFVVTKDEVREWIVDQALAKNVAGNLAAIVGYATTIALGEYAALRVLETDRAFVGSQELVVGALAVSAAFLVLAPTLALLFAVSAERTSWARATIPLAVVAIALMWCVPVYTLLRVVGLPIPPG
jgi:hypothetical protein